MSRELLGRRSDNGLPALPAVDVPGPAHPGRRRRLRALTAAAGLLSPSVIILMVVIVFPVLWSIALAFQTVPLLELHSAGFFGHYTLRNFRIVFSDPDFYSGLLVTLAYSLLGTGGALVIGTSVALALRAPFPGRAAVRVALLLPYIAPVVATTFVWRTALNPQFGIVNALLQAIGVAKPIAFLSQPYLALHLFGMNLQFPIALASVIAFDWWRTFPFVYLFVMARLSAIPRDVEEAAIVDGATPSQKMVYIVFPQLLSTLATLALLRFIWNFNAFDDIWLLTGGGAGTGVLSVRVFNFLSSQANVSLASAQAIVLAVLLLAAIVLANSNRAVRYFWPKRLSWPGAHQPARRESIDASMS